MHDDAMHRNGVKHLLPVRPCSDVLCALMLSPLPQFHPVVYSNSLGWIRREVMSVRVSSRNVRILDSSNSEIPCQVDAVWRDLGPAALAPQTAEFSVSFIVEVPPLGISTYFVLIGHGNVVPERKKHTHTNRKSHDDDDSQ